jgi:hypothetical protein
LERELSGSSFAAEPSVAKPDLSSRAWQRAALLTDFGDKDSHAIILANKKGYVLFRVNEKACTIV